MCAHKASEQLPALNTAQDQAPVKAAQCDIVDPHTAAVPARQPQRASQPQDASMDKVSTLSSFLQSCMKLLRNQNALKELQKFLLLQTLREELIRRKLLIVSDERAGK